MTVSIKLTKEQNDLLIERLGSEENVQRWIQEKVDQKMEEMAKAKGIS